MYGSGMAQVVTATLLQLYTNVTYRLVYVYNHHAAQVNVGDPASSALLSFRVAATASDNTLYEESFETQSTNASGKVSGFFHYRTVIFTVRDVPPSVEVKLQFNYTEMVRR